MESIVLAERSAAKPRPRVTLRSWATPLTIGAFVVMAVTGVLMFFGSRGGLTSEVHEWFSWIFLAGAATHVIVNVRPFTNHLKTGWGKASLAAAALLLALAVVPTGIRTGHQMHGLIEQAVIDAPLSTVAQLANVAPQELESRLKAHGVAASMDQSARQLSGQSGVDAREVLAIAFRND